MGRAKQMDADAARTLLEQSAGAEQPVVLPPSVLRDLTIDDLPHNTFVEIGIQKKGYFQVEWSGRLYREKGRIVGEADYSFTRKYWYAPLGLEQYLDLVRRAVEVRQRTHGDTSLVHVEDDGAFIELLFTISTPEKNLRGAYDFVRKVCSELEETADRASDEVGEQIAKIASRLSGWGNKSLESLVDAVDKAASTDEKGRTLEELCSRLFESISGFKVTGRVRSSTEEIDISILNDSSDPRFRRESALLLAECKNWSGKCGKNELVIFREKIENRNRRCSLGFLVSWNGFAKTVANELLRGSREELLLVPITGREIRSAVRDSDFEAVLIDCWDKAIGR